VSVPERRKPGRPRKYAFDELQPGQSFVVPGKRRDDLAPCIYAAQRRTGLKFMAMNTFEGVRIWRPSWNRPPADKPTCS
jgi:hypothetical protein